MLLELLSDFQITIPELGQVSATTMPIVVLTSNNSRELTEALKRRCLYLWLDYPELEREMEIVRLHAPELPEALARRLVEVVRMVRALDLKKPPSIAESIDWARTLLLMGAEDIDQRDLPAVDVDHRQAPHRHRPGRRASRGEACRPPDGPRPDGRPARASAAEAARLLRGAAQRGDRGRDLGDPRRLRRARTGALDLAGRLPRGAGGDDRQVPGGPPPVRAALRALVLPRRRGRGDRAGHRRGGPAPRGRRAARHRRAARADPPGDRRRRRRRDARPGAAGDRRLRPPGRGLGRDRRRRAADPPHAGPLGRAPSSRPRTAARSCRRSTATSSTASSATCAASSSAT